MKSEVINYFFGLLLFTLTRKKRGFLKTSGPSFMKKSIKIQFFWEKIRILLQKWTQLPLLLLDFRRNEDNWTIIVEVKEMDKIRH